jgi:hypothetical protein
MARSDRFAVRSDETMRDDEDRQTAGLAGIAVALFLVVVAFYLVRELHATSAIEDCLMAGRQNCDILVSLHH